MAIFKRYFCIKTANYRWLRSRLRLAHFKFRFNKKSWHLTNV